MVAAGEIVYLANEPEEGAKNDTASTGVLHVSVTKDQRGKGEPFSIPIAHLHKIEKPQWP
jgi:hypothetical protein